MHPDLAYEHDAALAEAEALRALAPAAYEAGYQAGFAAALERAEVAGGIDLRARIGAVLAAHGCECLGDSHVCPACRIQEHAREEDEESDIIIAGNSLTVERGPKGGAA